MKIRVSLKDGRTETVINVEKVDKGVHFKRHTSNIQEPDALLLKGAEDRILGAYRLEEVSGYREVQEPDTSH